MTEMGAISRLKQIKGKKLKDELNIPAKLLTTGVGTSDQIRTAGSSAIGQRRHGGTILSPLRTTIAL